MSWEKDFMPTAFIDIVFILVLYHVVLVQVANFAEYSEQTLPPVELSEMQSANENTGITDQRITYVTIQSQEGKIAYFVEDEPADTQQLRDLLVNQMPNEVCLRVDNSVAFKEVMKVWQMCKDNSIAYLSFAYKSGGKE